MCESTTTFPALEAKMAKALLPDRSAQRDFFVCDIFDAHPKGDMASMEHPIFSLSTRPDHRLRRYESGVNWLEIRPGAEGLATVHDRDVLIFAISQLIAQINEGKSPKQTIRFQANDLLAATNRGTDGRSYRRIKAAFERLAGTRITTNIQSGGEEITHGFGLIESFKIVRESRDGRMQEVELKLSDWVYSAVEAKEVLTLHRDYFRLRKPLERRLYEIGLKHCGTKREWKISLAKLKYKCGSNSTLREFRRAVKTIVENNKEHNYFPDFKLVLEDNILIFKNLRPAVDATRKVDMSQVFIDPETYELARAVAPGWDVYFLEQEWRNWARAVPKNADLAFIGFCRSKFKREGSP